MNGPANLRPDQCAVVFDWNGTLLNDSRLILDATNKVVERLGGSPVAMARYRRAYTLPLNSLYARLGFDEEVVAKNIDDVFHIWIDHYNKHADTTRLRHGARPLLRALKAKEYRAMILSNHITETIARQAQRLDIHHFFDDILANHKDEYRDILHQADKGSRLKHYVNRHDIRKALVIGDSAEEIEIAHAQGFLGVGIAEGCSSTQNIRAARPDFMIRSLTEMPKIIRKVFGRRGA